jgi:L,D-peptidoglycan transpeptidase YkuD (ErfK/YbiS/YcfS/YnhG family)
MIANSRTKRTIQTEIRALSRSNSRGALCLGDLRLPCALGRSGRRALKREGDGATPIGRWPIREAFYRADRLFRPPSALPLRAVRPDWGWCDAPSDRNYNRFVRLPYPASAESLWRDDAVYDIVIVLGYNNRPRRRGRGSAIFVHLARSGYAPTEGCVALSLKNLRFLLGRLRQRGAIHVP